MKRFDEEFDDEIRSHLQLETDRLIEEGLTPEQAARAARRAFGNVGFAREATRSVWVSRLWEGIRRDVWFAVRSLGRSPTFTVFAVLSIALGVGVNAAVFSVVNAVLVRPLPYFEPDRVVRIWETYRHPRGVGSGSVSYPNLTDWRSASSVFESFGGSSIGGNFTFTDGDRPTVLSGVGVEPELFSLFNVQPLLGRLFAPGDSQESDDRVVLLSYELWRDRYGADPAIVGQDIPIDGRNHTVVGVMPSRFQYPPRQRSMLWAPLPSSILQRSGRGGHWMRAYGRLKPEYSLAQAQVELETIAQRIEQTYPELQEGRSVKIEPITETYTADLRESLIALWGAVAIVLLVACGNVANLMLARASARRRDYAVRAALGASRARLIRYGLTESAAIALMGGTLGLILGWSLLQWALSLPGSGFVARLQPNFDLHVFGCCAAIAAAAAVISGTIPAFRCAEVSPERDLRDEGGRVAGPRSDRLRNSMVVAQIGLSLAVLIGAGLLQKSFARLQQVDMGFQAERVLTARIPLQQANYQDAGAILAFWDKFLDRVRALPGVTSAGAVNLLPLQTWGVNARLVIRDRPIPSYSERARAERRRATPGYFEALGVPLFAGRRFSESDIAAAPGVVIINRELAERHWPDADPIGRQIGWGVPENENDWLTIVGVVGNVRGGGPAADLDGAVYRPLAQSPRTTMSVVVRATVAPETLADDLRQVALEIDPEQPLMRVKPMEGVLADSVSRRRFNTVLFGVFAALALVLALGGIYGVTAYSVAQRTHEMGIRIALGAKRWDVLRLAMKRGLWVSGFGVVSGAGMAVVSARYLESQLFEVQALDSATYAAAALGVFFVAMLACGWPARKAASVDPLEALRYE